MKSVTVMPHDFRHWIATVSCALLASALWLPNDVQGGTTPDPQFERLQELRAASRVPVEVHFDQGIPRSLLVDVVSTGDTREEQARNFVSTYADLFLQGEPRTNDGYDDIPQSELVVRAIRSFGDRESVEFTQTLGGYPVFGATLAIIVSSTGRVSGAFGVLVPRRPMALSPSLTQAEAEATARMLVASTDAPILGETHLAVHDPVIVGEPSEPRLVWSVVVGGEDAVRLLIDADSGAERLRAPITFSGGGLLDDYDLYLQDANGGNIMDTQCFNPTTLDDYVGDESGIIPDYINDIEAANLWWHWRDTYSFFKATFGRESYDDDGEQIESYIYALPTDPNKPWGARYIATCGFEFMPGHVSFDVAVHEFAHAVIYDSSRLVYANQSGALDESFADVMAGVADPYDWLIGEDQTGGQGAIRSVADPLNGDCGPPSNPMACGDPDHMSLYVQTTADYGGVHTNSGIPNKAHYLFAEGGTHYGVEVLARNPLKMARLAYHAFRILPQHATFMDARTTERAIAAFWATNGTFGFNNLDICSITNAWAAVGVGQPDLNCDLVLDGTVDTDGDGHWDEVDNCPAVPNVIQWDMDMDGIGDSCDDDEDGDTCPDSLDNCPGFFLPCTGVYLGTPDSDGDGLGNACDEDDDNDGVLDTEDNCPGDPNPDQFDGDGNGWGDACDPDLDGDGFYSDADNCPFVANPAQTDTDEDGIGDACDDCPDTADNLLAYTPGNPLLGIDPEPYQPDSDGDGIPDACDATAFDRLRLEFNGALYTPLQPLARGNRSRSSRIEGPAGAGFSIPLEVCGPNHPALAPGRRVELVTRGLPETVGLAVTDELGSRVARLSPASGTTRGLWFTADCRSRYRVEGTLNADFSEGVEFVVDVLPTQVDDPFPWGSPGTGDPPPQPIADMDGDRQPDRLDNCPLIPNAQQVDSDGDGRGDACDSCNDSVPGPCEVFFDDGFEFRP